MKLCRAVFLCDQCHGGSTTDGGVSVSGCSMLTFGHHCCTAGFHVHSIGPGMSAFSVLYVCVYAGGGVGG